MEIAARALSLMYTAKTGVTPAPPGPDAGVRRVSVPVEELEKHSGCYATVVGFTQVELRRNRLTCDLMGLTMELVPRADGAFGLRALILGFVPVTPASLDGKTVSFERLAGHDLIVLDDRGQRQLFGTRAEPIPIPAAWHERVGRYVNPDPGEAGRYLGYAELHVTDGYLTVDALHRDLATGGRGVSRRRLKPLSETEAVVWRLIDYGDSLVIVEIDGTECVRFGGFTFVPSDS
jgi:hypothetical protein